MKEYCVDLDVAKELKENGFPQKGLFYRAEEDQGGWRLTPTSDEILKELPEQLELGYFQIIKGIVASETYEVGYASCGEFSYGADYFKDKKLSNALAKLWLYLKKEGYLK